MEKIDFSQMQVGEKIPLPSGKWRDELREFYDQANDYASHNHGVQFQIEGHEGSDFERGQYWIVRLK